MKLSEFIDNNIPLNRKERYYTGTVLPMILCQNNFRYLPRFLKMIDKEFDEEILYTKDKTNILFYTEYNLYESLKSIDPDALNEYDIGRDTPDIIILVDGKEKKLFAIEAKMFDIPDENTLLSQLKKQNKILNCIKERAKIDKIYHSALIPEELLNKYDGKYALYITWQMVLNIVDKEGDDYFVEILRIALNRYKELVSKRDQVSFGKHADDKMKGIDIYHHHKEYGIKRVGRNDGLRGNAFREDILSGKWETTLYEVGKDGTIPNKNWFSIENFIQSINAETDRVL